jgi:two-component system, cell cycle response regulator
MKPPHRDEAGFTAARAPTARKAAVLVIDDSPVHRAEVCRALESSREIGEIAAVADGIAGLKTLIARPFDAVICDLEMPGFDGGKLLAAKQQRPELADVPVLFVSANRDPARKARLLERGASDTIEKPFDAAELLARLGVHLRLRQLRQELSEKNAQLEQLSTTDALTGLRNRRFAESFLSREFERSRRHGDSMAVVLVDIDHFKNVNDVHGHAIGDTALRHIAEKLAKHVRKTDVCARWGGEEFLIVLVEASAEGACAFLERQRGAVEASPLPLTDGCRLSLTVSVGIAMYAPTDARFEDLIAAADSALYRAKRAGRNRVELCKR